MPLAQNYRRMLARVADRIPLDVIPVRPHPVAGHFLLPNEVADPEICQRCLHIAERILGDIHA